MKLPPIELPQTSVSLAEWGAGRTGGGSRISADYTARVREEAALPANALSHRFRNDCVRAIDSAILSTHVRDVVSALGTGGQHGINQVRCGGRGILSRRHWTQTCQSAWILSVGRRIGD